MAKVEGNRNFCNKLWNAARFVLMNVEGQDGFTAAQSAAAQSAAAQPAAGAAPAAPDLSLADRWVRSRLAAMLARVDAGFAGYRLDIVANALYDFTWNEFCDWYLELCKAVLQSETATAAEKYATRRTLIGTLETLLRALHPLAPFITEEIWQRVRPAAGVEGESIMLARFPTAGESHADAAAEPEMRWVMSVILGVRQIRGEMDIAPSRRLDVLLQNASPTDLEYLERNRHYLARLAGIGETRVLADSEAAPISAAALVGGLEILVPMAGLIDPEAELDRLARRRQRADAEFEKLRAKLSNDEFLRNAPPDVVAKDRARLAELSTEIEQLAKQIARVKKLRDQ
jgi:valyl-tRNA synthetase